MDGFAVFAFVNDEAHWAEMCESFVAAGFERPVRLSDRDSDPYETITRLGERDGYVILCHQDLRLDQGVGEPELRRVISDLNARDPCWTVAGNAGVTRSLRVVRRLVDASGGTSDDAFPVQVVSLDENFLILNCTRSPRCSAGLSGFHFYGADVCLNAIENGGTAYAIDFPMTHLGRGDRTDAYQDTMRRFMEVWDARCWLRYVGTTCEVLFMSRLPILRRAFGSARVLAWVRLHYRWSSHGRSTGA